MAQRKVKAKYRTVGPKKATVYINQSRMVNEKGSNVPSKQDETVAVEQETYMVYFPQGHSIRVTRPELVRMGYHLKPRLIDMETGDVVEVGGDPYDFMNMDKEEVEDHPDFDITLVPEDEEEQEQDIKVSKAAKG